MNADQPIDVDAILASLPVELFEPHDDPWGGANWARCGDPTCGCQDLPDQRLGQP